MEGGGVMNMEVCEGGRGRYVGEVGVVGGGGGRGCNEDGGRWREV